MLSNNSTSYSDPFQSLSASHNLFSRTVKAAALLHTAIGRLISASDTNIYTHTRTHTKVEPLTFECVFVKFAALCLSVYQRTAVTFQTMACRR